MRRVKHKKARVKEGGGEVLKGKKVKMEREKMDVNFVVSSSLLYH